MLESPIPIILQQKAQGSSMHHNSTKGDDLADETPFFFLRRNHDEGLPDEDKTATTLPPVAAPSPTRREGNTEENIVSPISARDALIGENFVMTTSFRSSSVNDDENHVDEDAMLLENDEEVLLLQTPPASVVSPFRDGGRLSITPIAGTCSSSGGGGWRDGIPYPSSVLSPPGAGTFESLSVSSRNSRPPLVPSIKLRFSGGATTMSAPLPKQPQLSTASSTTHNHRSSSPPPIPGHQRGRSASDVSILSALTDSSADFPPVVHRCNTNKGHHDHHPPRQRGDAAPRQSWDRPSGPSSSAIDHNTQTTSTTKNHNSCQNNHREPNNENQRHFGELDIDIPISLQQPILSDFDHNDDGCFDDNNNVGPFEALALPTPRTTTTESPSTNDLLRTSQLHVSFSSRRSSNVNETSQFEKEAETYIRQAKESLLDNAEDSCHALLPPRFEAASKIPNQPSSKDATESMVLLPDANIDSTSHPSRTYAIVATCILVIPMALICVMVFFVQFPNLLLVLILLITLMGQVSWSNLQGAFFVFVRRPFEGGDRILVSDIDATVSIEESSGWIVESMDAFATTVRHGESNAVATISNHSLTHKRIINLRKSGNAHVTIPVKMSIDTPISKILILRRTVELYVNDRPQEWLKLINFRASRLNADRGYIIYDLTVQHRASWQSWNVVLESKTYMVGFCVEVEKQLHLRGYLDISEENHDQ